jgi:Ran GTPase-activating protein (RanGAP) involved in mRNA processing and transport
MADVDPLDSEPESDNEDGADEIVFSPEFIADTGVREYQAACKRLGIIAVQQFIATIDQESVSLKHRGVGATGGVAIFECVRVNKCIRSLDVEDNQLGLGVDADAGGLEHIARALVDNEVITMLDLSFNNLSGRGCVALAPALGTNATIEDLSLRGNNLGDLGAIALARALGGNKTLTKIDLSRNAIDESGAVALAEFVGGCEQLRILDMSWNSIRLAGAEALMDALRNSKLLRLNFAWNGLGERGAKSLAGALADNRELQFLDISQNNLREEAAKHISEALRVNTTLRSLQLNGNAIGDRGLGMVLQAIGAGSAANRSPACRSALSRLRPPPPSSLGLQLALVPPSPHAR